MHVYSASLIPRPPASARVALQASVLNRAGVPSEQEHAFVSWLFHTADRNRVPAEDSFRIKAEQSLNVKKNKFAELQSIGANQFHDLIVQVVKEPYDLGDKISMWVSDYTENPAFFHHTPKAGETYERDDDPCGYLNKHSTGTGEPVWPGPYGKRAMQMTVWEPHAACIRAQVSAGDWVHLGNVHVKLGRNDVNLEGFLRGSRSAGPSRVDVTVMDPKQASENIDPRLKEALRRKRDYEGRVKKQKKGLMAEAESKKRGAVEEPPEPQQNSKRKRQQRREAQQRKQAEVEAREARRDEVPDLNELGKSKLASSAPRRPLPDCNAVVCEHPEQNTTPLSSLVAPVFQTTTVGGDEVRLRLPFINANYRTCAKVVGFRPRSLEDFAVSRTVRDYDCLSDKEDNAASSSVDSALSSDEEPDTLGAQRIWEWCFQLQLEDATSPGRGAAPARLWVTVGNHEAQLLTDLDATNLRRDERALALLRERMFTLWGDLEEKKTAELAALRAQSKSATVARPPDSSSDDDRAVGRLVPKSSQPRHRPFVCCVRQYGIKTRTRDRDQMDAGPERRWERVFGLFGTKISVMRSEAPDITAAA